MTDAPLDASDSDVDVFEQEPGENPRPDARWVALPSADMLTLEGADGLLRWRPASLVAVIGERNGGKTTLVTEIYERLLRGRFADHQFAHSLTLLGFERKSFLSRAVSRARKPDTPRTSAGDGLSFFHLALSGLAANGRRDLLISERAGEVYREVRDRPASAHDLPEVVKADVLAFVIDGERLADNRRRPEALASTRNVARGCLDSGAVRATARLQLVTTKIDLLAADSAGSARDALAAFERRFVESYSGRFAAVTTHRTAARDPEGVLDPATGVAPLLSEWLQPPRAPAMTLAALPDLTDEFDRLLTRGRAR